MYSTRRARVRRLCTSSTVGSLGKSFRLLRNCRSRRLSSREFIGIAIPHCPVRRRLLLRYCGCDRRLGSRSRGQPLPLAGSRDECLLAVNGTLLLEIRVAQVLALGAHMPGFGLVFEV